MSSYDNSNDLNFTPYDHYNMDGKLQGSTNNNTAPAQSTEALFPRDNNNYTTSTTNMKHNDSLTNYLNVAFGHASSAGTGTADNMIASGGATCSANSNYNATSLAYNHHGYNPRQESQQQIQHNQYYSLDHGSSNNYQDNNYYQQSQQQKHQQHSNYSSYHPINRSNQFSFHDTANTNNNPNCGYYADTMDTAGTSTNGVVTDSISGLLKNSNSNHSMSANSLIGGNFAGAGFIKNNDNGETATTSSSNDPIKTSGSRVLNATATGGYLMQQPLDYCTNNVMNYYNSINQQFQIQKQQQQQQQQQKQQHDKLYDLYNMSNNSFDNNDISTHATFNTTTDESNNNIVNTKTSSINNNNAIDTIDVAGYANSYFGGGNSNHSHESNIMDTLAKGLYDGNQTYQKNIAVVTAAAVTSPVVPVVQAMNLIEPIGGQNSYYQHPNNHHQLKSTTTKTTTPTPMTDTNGNRHNTLSISRQLSKVELSIISLSEKTLSAQEIIDKITFRCNEVMTRFLPCVEFLVACQQELRSGLTRVMSFCGTGMSVYSAQEFYKTCFETLPARFYERNKHIMPLKELTDSYEGVKTLLIDVKRAEQKGDLDGMKNAFLGGMRDGESWGLRKWLSKNGGALKICNDVELIWGALRNLSREEATTKELASILRPKAKFALKRLQEGVPKAYQEVSTAHPYLPFFHRLECALKGLSEFDPEDDDVICIDDSEDDDQDEAEVSDSNNKPGKPFKMDKDAIIDIDDDDDDDDNDDEDSGDGDESNNDKGQSSAIALAESIDGIANKIEAGTEIRPSNLDFDDYWTRPDNYIRLLRLFQKILLENDSDHLTDHVTERKKYIALIKNPLCFRDIVVTLCQYETESRTKGQLQRICPNLKRWNVFEGKYLIQAVDLVFLNNLAFLGKKSNVARKIIQALRTKFWNEIRKGEKKYIPTRRTESSEFVIRK